MHRKLVGACVGEYRFVAFIGSGGTAEVYRAVQTSTEREVAVKVIDLSPLDRWQRVEMAERFDRAARAITALEHPHILKMHDWGDQDDLTYLAMDLMPGSLAEQIKRQPMPMSDVHRIFGQVASAIDYAHGQGIVHRDIKPPNVLLDAQGDAYLMDFGLARIQSELTSITRHGMAVGSPAYMSPEQWRGEVDPRTDIYAMGVVLFEMLSGHLPFLAADPYRFMTMHMEKEVPSIRLYRPSMPEHIDEVLRKALAKAPEMRYQSVGELAEALRRALPGDYSYTAPEGVAVVQTSAEGARPSSRASQVGAQIGNYAIVALKEENLLSVTYRASQTTTQLHVALKVIETGPMPDIFLRDFKRDATDLMNLRHRRLLKMVECGAVANMIYIASELGQYTSLADLLKQGALPPSRIGQIVAQIAAGLDYAHKQGFLHGDLKPQSIFIDEYGDVVIADTGLVDILDHYSRCLIDAGLFTKISQEERTSVTSRNGIGLPRYVTPGRLAPERWMGERGTARSDVYALGILLYEMLTNRLPFESDNVMLMGQMHLMQPPPPIPRSLSEKAPNLDGVMRTALAKDPRQRFTSATELAEAFQTRIMSLPT
jgi:serine/threonine-protein kinase